MTLTDPNLWKHKAMAFSVRCHRHLWGKNNEDPLAFLYLRGISIDLSKSLYLGWNKFPHERPRGNWGISGEGRFPIPPGIVFPHIIDKELISIFIIAMDDPFRTTMLPGSDPSPVVLGNPDSPSALETRDLLQGLSMLQENPESRIRITVT